MSGSGLLAGRGIVVTRPAHQAQALATMIRGAGGTAVVFPVLEILDTANPAALRHAIDRLEAFDLAMFISPNAVQRVMDQVVARRRWPPGLRVAAIGKGGVRELKRYGLDEVIAPERRYDSERLLEMPQLQQLAGKRVLIFRGDGGRELLGDTLAARGARVEYVESYRRAKPQVDAAPLLQAWARHEIDAVTITSSEGLHNFSAMLGESGLALLQATALLAPHPRIAAAARELGCARVIETQPGDEGLFAALLQLFRGE